jgi:hypothetical protein
MDRLNLLIKQLDKRLSKFMPQVPFVVCIHWEDPAGQTSTTIQAGTALCCPG